MSVEFAPGQEVRLHLPGGVFRATIVAKTGDKEYTIHVPDENPVRRVDGRGPDEFAE